MCLSQPEGCELTLEKPTVPTWLSDEDDGRTHEHPEREKKEKHHLCKALQARAIALNQTLIGCIELPLFASRPSSEVVAGERSAAIAGVSSAGRV